MTVPLSRMVALAFAVLVLGAATTASARPKKQSAEHTATTTTNCHGTPLIMQGMDCPTRPVRAAEQEQEQQQQEQATKRAERPRLTARGSSGAYIAPLQRTPSLSLPQPSAAPYIPPPVNNPSAQINQLNHSFPLNGGLGNNPTNRDAYIRYNLTR
jgi:cytochrome c553